MLSRSDEGMLATTPVVEALFPPERCLCACEGREVPATFEEGTALSLSARVDTGIAPRGALEDGAMLLACVGVEEAARAVVV